MSDSERNLISAKKKASAEISEIEADVAYFDARLSLLGDDPETPYQKAQLKTYQIIESQLTDSLEKKRKEHAPVLKKK
jgi:hypothetical protein